MQGATEAVGANRKRISDLLVGVLEGRRIEVNVKSEVDEVVELMVFLDGNVDVVVAAVADVAVVVVIAVKVDV